METKVQSIYGDAYKKWLEKNYPDQYESKYGKKKPESKLKKFAKRAGLVGIVYELGKEVLKLENAGEGSTIDPYDIESREIIRRRVIEDNIPKLSYDEKGKMIYTAGKNVNLKDYLPYKKQIKKSTPDAPGGEEVQGLDYVWKDPLDDQYGSIEHFDDADKYQLTEFGYVKKSLLKDPIYKRVTKDIASDIKTAVSYVPPEIRKQVKTVKDALVYTATGGRY
jgi:hypothetical protein